MNKSQTSICSFFLKTHLNLDDDHHALLIPTAALEMSYRGCRTTQCNKDETGADVSI